MNPNDLPIKKPAWMILTYGALWLAVLIGPAIALGVMRGWMGGLMTLAIELGVAVALGRVFVMVTKTDDLWRIAIVNLALFLPIGAVIGALASWFLLAA